MPSKTIGRPAARRTAFSIATISTCFLILAAARGAESWPQAQLDARRSGNAADRTVSLPLGLIGVVPLSDAVFTSPAVDGSRAYIVDGSGTAWAIDARRARVIWKFAPGGGRANVNNVSSPALAGPYVHFGTMAGTYYVLRAEDGSVVREIPCGEPIFSSPAVAGESVFFATLGSRIHALRQDGTVRWTWDYVKEHIGFDGDRWSGEAWYRARGRGSWRDQFCCTRDVAVHEGRVIAAAGGTVAWLEDLGDHARLERVYLGPDQRESPCTLGLSVGEDGVVYRQWTRRDNEGNVDVIRAGADGFQRRAVAGTGTSYRGAGLLSFSSVAIRGGDIFRCRPQEGHGLCRHGADGTTSVVSSAAAIAPPVILRDHAVYGGLDGRLRVVSLAGDKDDSWSFATLRGAAISAAPAVSCGRIYFGAEDGYFYVLGPEGKAAAPEKDLGLHEIRSPPASAGGEPRAGWFTSFGNFANTNASPDALRPPFAMRWIRRYEGTVKHFSVCGGGRLYTHTAEGQIFAVEEETGRLLWRRYSPGVHVSYTSPLYWKERVIVPQAGLEECRLRCLDAGTGELVWEAPFSGSPSWNRQMPPIVHDGLVIYCFSSGRFSPEGWLFEHQSTFGFPADHKPLVRAWRLETGEEVWTRDFSEHGAGGDDAGMCLLDGTIYYSVYFGDKKPQGLTAALDPRTGETRWLTTDHSVHAGCTVSGAKGRIYLGGYNPVEGKVNRVWCLDAKDGSLVWKSEPVSRAIHVVTVGERFLFTHSQYQNGYLIDKETGAILRTLTQGYRCTRFTLAEPHLFGANFDTFDLSGEEPRMVSSGPVFDVLLCVSPIPSGGRLFYTTNGTGLQVCQAPVEEAESAQAPRRGR
ncbi:MAG: PQQ-binding-like beta-propeller repeat protein [Planctomycetes bacterium]|nr:PQQ-binding-like beta-propeller repeat protein [Planctomycetota bacterium]